MCRILVVDDNKDVADSMAMLLRMMGQEVHVVYDGLEAVAAALAFQPHVALLDLGLPKLNGYETAARIREQQGAAVVLIAVTGRAEEEDLPNSSKAVFDHYLLKPVKYANLEKLLPHGQAASAVDGPGPGSLKTSSTGTLDCTW
jgi:CheY-like chemotaxis protein